MKKLFVCLFFIFILFSANSLDKIEAFFVSNLMATVSNGKVLLNWRNPSTNQIINIYRSDSTIDTEEKLNKATKIATLTNNEEKYIDNPFLGTFYYAIITSSIETNKPNIIFVQFRNYTSKEIVIKNKDLFKITRINAKSTKSSIIIEWDYTSNSTNPTNIVLYRNTDPILNESVLVSSIKITTQKIDVKSFLDIPISKIKYFYAISLENDNEKEFIPNVTITTDSVFIESKIETINTFSTENFIPLPLISLQMDPKSGKDFLDPQILKNPQKIKYNDKLKEIITKYKKDNEKLFDKFTNEELKKMDKIPVHILNDEEIFITKDYAMEYNKAIELIKGNDYNNALYLLEELLIETIPQNLFKRISYYIGMIYYLNGDYYQSYLYFVLCLEDFRKEILPYITSIYLNIFSTLER
ncbi:MAG: hypothetical protein A2086_05145 [Spirochaetes bacterium GWD1_27_9]|nr:MAG: hypothetical protein A2Z98_15145 [Spirochaetes bacterium GWB1_27_13]OHD22267.1 MAG: hypothetical protein A2Y34_06070 [Spirochaetes bacterium GWC1_27_15]OHD30232.1 MAG: hypothetical protein A2086_05145 [Spirochaetes bacterium GWD1_27_9]